MLFYLLPVVAGTLLAFTLPFAGASFLSWVALVPLFLFISGGVSTRYAVWGGVCAGTIYGFVVLFPLLSLGAWWWLADGSLPFTWKEEILFGLISVVALTMGGGALALLSLAYKKALRFPLIFSAPALGLLFFLIERVREPLVLGFTWGHIGYALADTPLLPLAGFLGVSGLSGVVIGINVLFAAGVRALIEERHRYALRVLLPTTALLVGMIALGFILPRDMSGTTRVAVIHTSMTTAESTGMTGFTRTLSLLREALASGPDLVVLPENAFPFIILEKSTMVPLGYDNPDADIRGLYEELMGVSREHPDSSIVMGVLSRDGGTEYNSFAVLEGGRVAALSDKQALLPFAENAWFFNRGHVNAKAKGAALGSVPTQHGPVSPFICSEIIYPRLSQDTDALLINIANDSVFTDFLPSKQNHLIAKMRAAERRAYLLRSVKGGTSSIIDPYGRSIVDSQEPFVGEILYAEIPAWDTE